MKIIVGGPKSEIEAESRKRFITEKEVKEILESKADSKELRLVKAKIRELLEFYDRIISSISLTIKNVKSQTELSNQFKQEKYIKTQEKDLSQAKTEKMKFRKLLNTVEVRLGEI